MPLALAFPIVVNRPRAAVAVLFAAGLTDVLDGFLARRFRWATPMGAVVDPITDKVFVLTVAASLVATGKLSLGSAVLLSTRELGEAPLLCWVSTSQRVRRGHLKAPKANLTGKLATTLQFASIALALMSSPMTRKFVGATAVVGTIAAASYFARTLAAHRRGGRTLRARQGARTRTNGRALAPAR